MRKLKLLSQKGFTLIEVMISASLIMIALLGANAQFIQQMKSEGSVNAQLVLRQVLNQVMSKLRAATSEFPAYYNGSGTPISYISCFTERGEQTVNKSPHLSTAYFGDYLADTTVASDYCPEADIEVHVTRPFTAEPNRVRVDVIVLPTRGVRVYKMAREKFQVELFFNSTL